MPKWIMEMVLAFVREQAAQANLRDLEHQHDYLMGEHTNGAGIFLLLRHIRRWGSISVAEAGQLLGAGEEAVEELLNWLAAFLQRESEWTNLPALDQARVSRGLVFFTRPKGAAPIPEPPVRHSKTQKAIEERQHRRRRSR